MITATRLTLQLAAAALLGAGMFGPPHITVRAVTPGSSAPQGAVLLIDASHHDETGQINVVGRAEGMRGGKRVTIPLRVASTERGRYSVSRQWDAGAPWLIVLTAEEGPNGAHAVAEAMATIDAAGRVVHIDYPAPGWVETTNTPRRTSPREIDAMVASLRTAR